MDRIRIIIKFISHNFMIINRYLMKKGIAKIFFQKRLIIEIIFLLIKKKNFFFKILNIKILI